MEKLDVVQEIVEVPESMAPKLLNAVECPRKCGGQLQVYIAYDDDGMEQPKVVCYDCGCEVDLSTVEVRFNVKND